MVCPTVGTITKAQEDGRERRYVRALVLAYLASLNRSLFAAKCLVEVVVEMYREGVTLEDAKLLLSLASLQQGGQLLGPMDEDILVNYVAVIMIALEMVGVPLKPEGEARMRELGRRNPADDEAGLIAGLRGMVRVAVDQFLAGTDLFRLQLQQSMAAKMGGEAGGFSPAVQMLQQNTRLVIIALEVVRGMGLPTTVALQEPPPPGPAGEAQEPDQAQLPQRHWVPGFLRACDPEAASGGSADEQQRAAAVRLLISFMGAAQGFLYPAWDFVQQAIECYSNGWSADDVYSRLRDEEFAQSGGMALQVARLPGTPNLTAAVFARFLSIVYMTLAQLGVIFPGAARQEGWAWVSGAAEMHAAEEASATSLEAYGLADFVLNTIRNEERKEREGRGAAAAGAASGVEAEGVLARPSPNQLQQQQREGFVSIEDPSLLASSPAVLVMSQQISLVQMARQLVLREREQAAAPPAAA